MEEGKGLGTTKKVFSKKLKCRYWNLNSITGSEIPNSNPKIQLLKLKSQTLTPSISNLFNLDFTFVISDASTPALLNLNDSVFISVLVSSAQR